MANGTPSKNIHDVESHRIVGLEKANILLGSCVPSLKVGQPVLLRHLLGNVFSLEVEEHKPTQEEGKTRAEAYHNWGAELCVDSKPSR